MSKSATAAGPVVTVSRGHPRASSARIGVLAGLGLAVFYIGIVGGASGSLSHLVSQARTDWYFLVALVAGFGTQVGLVAELRRRHRLQATAASAGVAGAGASTLGMVACCAHHIADLAPFLGASAAATFLTAYKLPFILVGLAVNGVGITVAVRRLRSLPPIRTEDPSCALG